jgi:hypothetical protein
VLAAEIPAGMKACPHCHKAIRAEASRCKHCKKDLDQPATAAPASESRPLGGEGAVRRS